MKKFIKQISSVSANHNTFFGDFFRHSITKTWKSWKLSFNLCPSIYVRQPFKLTTGNSFNAQINVVVNNKTRKLLIFWNSVDTETSFSFLRRQEMAWHNLFNALLYLFIFFIFAWCFLFLYNAVGCPNYQYNNL